PDAKTASDLRLADHGRSFEARDSRAGQRPSFARRSGLREGGSAASQSRTGLGTRDSRFIGSIRSNRKSSITNRKSSLILSHCRKRAGAAGEAHRTEVVLQHRVAAAGRLLETPDELKASLMKEGEAVGHSARGHDVMGHDN